MLVITTYRSNGGERRIRTFETFVAELQSAPFDRSGISPFHTYISVRSLLQLLNSLRWCRHTDSNCGPTDYKSVALPTELCRRFLVFRTFRIGTVCSLANFKTLAGVFFKKRKKTYKISPFDDNSTDLITARAFICVSFHSDSGFES